MDGSLSDPADLGGASDRPDTDAHTRSKEPLLLGLGDVHELIRWGLVVACLLDAVSEATWRPDEAVRDTSIALVSAIALILNRRIGAAITAIGLLFTLYTSHEFLVFSIAAILALFPSPKQLNLLVKVQLTALWLFAGLAKLGSNFLSGAPLNRGNLLLIDALPTSVLVWGTILIEAVILPVLLWTRPRLAMWAAIAFQMSIMIGMSTYMSGKSMNTEISFVSSLWAFGLLTISCVVAVTTFDRNNRNDGAKSPPQ
jgi:hypothetical protein